MARASASTDALVAHLGRHADAIEAASGASGFFASLEDEKLLSEICGTFGFLDESVSGKLYNEFKSMPIGLLKKLHDAANKAQLDVVGVKNEDEMRRFLAYADASARKRADAYARAANARRPPPTSSPRSPPSMASLPSTSRRRASSAGCERAGSRTHV